MREEGEEGGDATGPRWSVLRASRCEVAWRKEKKGGLLRVHLRYINQRGVFLAVGCLSLLLTAISVGMLAYLHVDLSFLAMACSPIIIFIMLVVAYKGESLG